MKTLFVAHMIWTFVVPCVVAICLILTFLAAFVPNPYLVFSWLLVAFAPLAIMWGSLRAAKSS